MVRSWLNLVLLLAVLLLAALVYFEPGKQVPQVDLLSVNPAELQQIEIKVPGRQEVILQRRQGQWYLQSPVEVAADAFMVGQILSFLSQPSLQRYPAVDLDLTKYGLQPARVSLVVDGLELDFGRVNPLNSHLYVKVADVMHMVLQNEISMLLKDWPDYAARAPLPKEALVKLELPGLGLLVHEAQGWRYEGDDAPPSAAQLQGLVEAWGAARAVRVQLLRPRAAEPVVLTFASGRVMHLSVLWAADELILQRADLGLEYVFDASQAARLLQWSPLVDESGG
ncbi:MAG TPA: hypothetical protein ENJ65_04725 [Candidatus Tenderia electrophaga]|uniref:DUF4340 domain-containing protein n=1 Tax=Candidatus Tenderia electrophaga TaxID=1748243 RepID=A0A832J4H8_9GAMM|nr:hypothetical protein [Candidatus Tenderia electrophaga]